MTKIVHERPEHAAAIDALHEDCFGPGRFARTAFLIREGVETVPELSFVAFDETCSMIGSVRLSPILIGEAPALLLGPLAVLPHLRGKGTGVALMNRALDDARALGHKLVVLIGDEPYYAKLGFSRVPDGRLVLPGPYDPARLLYRELVDGAMDGVEGEVRGDRAFQPPTPLSAPLHASRA